MPELPEVETITQELCRAQLIGHKIIDVEVIWSKIIHSPSPSLFKKQLAGQTIKQIHRIGKYIVFTLDRYFLVVHLRMTGKLSLESANKHEHLRIFLDDGRVISYQDTRKFGRWQLLSTLRLSVGMDPFSDQFNEIALENMLSSHKGMIKPFLLNQKFIAGIGNIYADEALWEAAIHPQQLTNRLTRSQIHALYLAIKDVLSRAVAARGTSLGSGKGNYRSFTGEIGQNQNFLKVYNRQNDPCYRCHEKIQKIVVCQRGTHFCPHCQKKATH